MGKTKEIIGIVTSNKMQKTIVVRVVRASKHPKYGRIIKQSSKYKAHDEKNVAKIGDTVKIQETRPLSKDKRFRLIGIIKKTEIAEGKVTE